MAEETPFIKIRKQFLKEKDAIVAKYEEEINKLKAENQILSEFVAEFKAIKKQFNIGEYSKASINRDNYLANCSDCGFEINVRLDDKAKQSNDKYLCEICRGD